MAHRYNAILAAALALAACSTPVARVPDIDRDRARAEAAVQNAAVLERGPMPRHVTRLASDPIARDLQEAARITHIGWRILTAGAALCGDRTGHQIGALFETIHDVTPLRDMWYDFIRLDNDAVTMAVAPGSPAEQAGLKPGDTVLAVDGGRLLRGKVAVEQLQQALDRSGPISMEVLRGEQNLTLTVEPVQTCRSRLRHDRWSGVNAFADGKTIAVTAGMVNFITDDDHLAAAIGHELAHNMMGHLEKQDENGKAAGRFGSFLSALTGAPELESHWTKLGERAYSRAFEAEADYVGLYFAAIAGFDIAKAPQFWRRMAAANPLTISHASSHPTTPDRYVALEDTAREIAAKQAQGTPLKPERK
ncbi:MAG: M48 family metalloprotease [Magnetospirillum sp.]|nr:M48 family metalloprotease [Magnetospirillum sp.]